MSVGKSKTLAKSVTEFGLAQPSVVTLDNPGHPFIITTHPQPGMSFILQPGWLAGSGLKLWVPHSSSRCHGVSRFHRHEGDRETHNFNTASRSSLEVVLLLSRKLSGRRVIDFAECTTLHVHIPNW